MQVGFVFHNLLLTIPRPRVVIVDDQQRVLLVRQWGAYGRWSLPGGGAQKGESAKQAAQREIREELGLDAGLDQFEYIATMTAGYQAPLFLLRIQPDDLPPQPFQKWEIAEVAWYNWSALPARLDTPALLARQELESRGEIRYNKSE